jgi:hypothetical protein
VTLVGVVVVMTSAGAQSDGTNGPAGSAATSAAGLSTQVLVVLAIAAVALMLRQRFRLRRSPVSVRR